MTPPADVSELAAVPAATPFGSAAAHLDIDFAALRAPQAVSAVLQACLGPLPDGDVWRWTLDRRLKALLAVAIATHGRESAAVVACPDRDCGEPIGLELDLTQFAAATAAEEIACGDDDTLWVVRAPTGADQLAWQAAAPDAPDLAGRIAATLLRPAPADAAALGAAALARLDDALASIDPLTALQLEVVCPACGRVARLDFDLERHLLGRLRDAQRAVLGQVHALARAYHWDEAVILALPAWRRSAYLARVAAEHDA